MNRILKKRWLAENVVELEIEAPEAVRNARPGQFVILRVDEEGERVPFTICDMDRERGSITLLVQTVGYSTARLAALNEGDFVHDFTAPLGNATDLDGYSRVLLVGGGIGTAVIFPQAKHLREIGKPADIVVGARNKSLLMYEEEFRRQAGALFLITDDGSSGRKGFVTDVVRELISRPDSPYDVVFAVGPLPMMRAVCEVTRPFGLRTIVSMNSIMVDGTGMCGGCRLTVGGQVRYACVHGPEFDGHQVDFEEAINRSGMYREQEQAHSCRLKERKI